MRMKEEQFCLIKAQIKKLMGQGGFYSKKFAGIDPDSLQSQEDFEKLPFTWKGDLRDAYPLGLQAVPDEEVVRIHSSSGTTGYAGDHPIHEKGCRRLGFDVQALL